MKNKKRIAISAAALAGCLVIGGTFAWFSTTDKVANKFDMDAFDVAITEDFDQPEVPLVPGADITKNVTVTNSGNMDVVVRVKLEEMLQLLERYTEDGTDKLKVTYTSSATAGENQVPVLMSDEMITAYTNAGYSEYDSNNPSGVTVLRKETTAKDDDKGIKGNTVYSYIAYAEIDDPSYEGDGEAPKVKHVVKVTPQGEDKSSPTSFTAEYAYHTYKDGNGDADGTALEGTHGIAANETAFDKYYAGDSAESGAFHKAVVLNFAANVDLNNKPEEDWSIDSGAKWYLAEDGYFYYTEKLVGNSISAPLLESVSIKEEAANALQGAKYELTPVMEASQAEKAAVESNWTASYGNTTIRAHIDGLLGE